MIDDLCLKFKNLENDVDGRLDLIEVFSNCMKEHELLAHSLQFKVRNLDEKVNEFLENDVFKHA